jgi:hypothetical protein
MTDQERLGSWFGDHLLLWLAWPAAGMCLCAAFSRQDARFYEGLRWTVLAAGLVSWAVAHRRQAFIGTSCLWLAVIFNPLWPLAMTRQTWTKIDLAGAVLLFAAGALPTRRVVGRKERPLRLRGAIHSLSRHTSADLCALVCDLCAKRRTVGHREGLRRPRTGCQTAYFQGYRVSLGFLRVARLN